MLFNNYAITAIRRVTFHFRQHVLYILSMSVCYTMFYFIWIALIDSSEEMITFSTLVSSCNAQNLIAIFGIGILAYLISKAKVKSIIKARQKEYTIRYVYGESRRRLLVLTMLELLMLSIISLVIGLIFIDLIIPLLNVELLEGVFLPENRAKYSFKLSIYAFLYCIIGFAIGFIVLFIRKRSYLSYL